MEQTERVIQQLIEWNSLWGTWTENLRSAGMEFNREPDFDFGGLALDLLGVPADTTADLPPEPVEVPTGTFCRDWFYELWDKATDASDFISAVEQGMKP